MSLKAKLIILGVAWIAVITALHGWLNVNWASVLNDYRPAAERKISVAYIPVTCQLTCPVTDYISKFSHNGEIFIPRLFQGLPEIKEALISNKVQAAFIVAPLAIALKAQGVPIKVVYLGHRYGSAMVVQKEWPCQEPSLILRGLTVAIPSRFSDERLMLIRAMKIAGHETHATSKCSRWPRQMSPARFAQERSTDLSWVNPFPRRQRWQATAASSFRRGTIGLTTCPAFSSCART